MIATTARDKEAVQLEQTRAPDKRGGRLRTELINWEQGGQFVYPVPSRPPHLESNRVGMWEQSFRKQTLLQFDGICSGARTAS